MRLLTSLALVLDEEARWHPCFPNNLLAGSLVFKLPGARYVEQSWWKCPDSCYFSCLDHRSVILKISFPKIYPYSL